MAKKTAQKDGVDRKSADLFAIESRIRRQTYATRTIALPPAAKVFSLIWLFSASRPPVERLPSCRKNH
jgi:hypothetical protein